jgi:hypothetical protein
LANPIFCSVATQTPICTEVVRTAIFVVLAVLWFALTSIFVVVSKSDLLSARLFSMVWLWAMWGLVVWDLVLAVRWVKRRAV